MTAIEKDTSTAATEASSTQTTTEADIISTVLSLVGGLPVELAINDGIIQYHIKGLRLHIVALY